MLHLQLSAAGDISLEAQIDPSVGTARPGLITQICQIKFCIRAHRHGCKYSSMYKWHKQAVSYPSLVPFRFVASHVPFRLGQRGLQLNAASWIVRLCVCFCCMLYMQHCNATCYRQPGRLSFLLHAASSGDQQAACSRQPAATIVILSFSCFVHVRFCEFVLLTPLSIYAALDTYSILLFSMTFPDRICKQTASTNRPVLSRPTVCPSFSGLAMLYFPFK